MAELVLFYEGGVTTEGFDKLDAGQLQALIRYRKAVIEARKEAAKSNGQ